MKKIIITAGIVILTIVSAKASFATSGACSAHYGVNCGVESTYGDAVCNDGWTSATLYSQTDECRTVCTPPSVSICSVGGTSASIAANGLGGSPTASSLINSCTNQQQEYQSEMSAYESCIAGVYHPVTLAPTSSYGISPSAQAFIQTLQSSSAALSAEVQKVISLTQLCQSSFNSSSIYSETQSKCVCFEGSSTIQTQCSSSSTPSASIASTSATPATTSSNLFANLFPSQATTTVSIIGSNLQVGSAGNDVVTLQKFLEGKGFLVMPAGSSEGYFGSATKKALIAFQVSAGLPATGYCGSMTRTAIGAGK